MDAWPAVRSGRAEITSFFGFDLAKVFPYNLMRTWHVQLALYWVATSFVAAGIFLAPIIAAASPKHPRHPRLPQAQHMTERPAEPDAP